MKQHNGCEDVPSCLCLRCAKDLRSYEGKPCCCRPSHRKTRCPTKNCPDFEPETEENA